MKAVVISNGNVAKCDIVKKYIEDSIIIACDGGINHCYDMGITPNYIIGDFDSAKTQCLEYYKNMGIDISTYPTKKDMTDTEIGLEMAIEKGADTVYIFGGTGTRLDHTLANIHLLIVALKKDITAQLIDDNNVMQAMDSSIELEGKAGDIVSIIPMTTEVRGITNKGLEYPLCDYVLGIGAEAGRGVSNVMLGKKAEISIKEGILLVIRAVD